MKKSLAAAALLASLALVGCSSTAPANVPAPAGATTTTADVARNEAPSAAAPASSAPAAASASSAEAADTWTKPFGSTFKWDDGVEFTLTAPKSFKPGEYFIKPQNKKLNEYVIMDATLVNKTSEPLSPMSIYLQATSGESEAEKIFDSEAGIDLPSADIMPGKTAKFKVGFARVKGQEFVVSVANHHDFTSKNGYYK